MPPSRGATPPTEIMARRRAREAQKRDPSKSPATEAANAAIATAAMKKAAPNSKAPPVEERRSSRRPSTMVESKARKTTFPHAFERWEQLSSHWEGLTGFWIRRLEQNKEEMQWDSLNQQLARQVTDLSAAGANLFQAVVELQRLRASSERKFQRWFHEARADQEKADKVQSHLEEELRKERERGRPPPVSQRNTADSTIDQDVEALEKQHAALHSRKEQAERELQEVRRELTISKDEARRAWEELGRREEEDRERTKSLKNGAIVHFAGIPVHAARVSDNKTSPPTNARYSQTISESDTDPFTDHRARDPEVLEQQILPILASQSTRAARPVTTTTTTSIRCGPWPHGAPGTSNVASLGGGPGVSETATNRSETTPFYAHAGIALHNGESRNNEASRTTGSQASPLVTVKTRSGPGSEDSEDEDVARELERERMHAKTYWSGAKDGSGATSHVPLVLNESISTVASSLEDDDSELDFGGGSYGSGWETLPRQHHPTRLSDVLEEDERSRATMSRASQRSRSLR